MNQKILIIIGIGVLVLIIAATLAYSNLTRRTQLPLSVSQPSANIDLGSLEQRAKEAIVSKFQINKNDIAQLTIEAVDWPDTSLGCPKEGEVYAQVITLGYKVQVQLKSNPTQIRQFHTNEDLTQIVECSQSAKP